MTWLIANALLTVLLLLLCYRAWAAGRSRSRAEARWREMERRALDVMADLARQGTNRVPPT